MRVMIIILFYMKIFHVFYFTSVCDNEGWRDTVTHIVNKSGTYIYKTSRVACIEVVNVTQIIKQMVNLVSLSFSKPLCYIISENIISLFVQGI